MQNVFLTLFEKEHVTESKFGKSKNLQFARTF